MSNYGLQQLFPEGVSATTATNSVELGTERWENGKKYVYVYNKTTSTATVKNGVVYSAASGYSVTISSTIGERCAGVVVHTDIEPHYYGWIMTRGFQNVKGFGATVSKGTPIILVADGGFGIQTGNTGGTGVFAGACTDGGTAATATFMAFISVA